LKLHHLRDLLAIAERGSLRAAARHLGLAQAALSRSINELERDLGIELFERRAQGMTLTESGKLFLRRARAVQNELERARNEIDQSRGINRGRVAVGLSSVAHIALFPYALRTFRAKFPDVFLDVHDGVYPTVENLLADGTLDLYVGPPPEILPPIFTLEKLFDNTRYVIGRKGHPQSDVQSLSQLTDAHWIGTSITHRPEEEIGPVFAQHGLPAPQFVIQARSAMTSIIAVASSDLLAMLPVQFTDFPLIGDSLQRIPVREHLPAAPICIIQRSGFPLTPAAEHFVDMIRRASAHLASTTSSTDSSPVRRRPASRHKA
jgi:LysR family transcriptional regulator, regulator of abg operon